MEGRTRVWIDGEPFDVEEVPGGRRYQRATGEDMNAFEAPPTTVPVRCCVSHILEYRLVPDMNRVAQDVATAQQELTLAIGQKLGPYWTLEGGPTVTQLICPPGGLNLLVTMVGLADMPVEPEERTGQGARLAPKPSAMGPGCGRN